MRKTKLFLAAVMILPLFAAVSHSAQRDAIIQKYFTLYPGQKGDPYTMFYPIELTRPGQITISVKTKLLTPPLEKKGEYEPLRAVLVDARAFKKIQPSQWKQWIRKANKFNPLEYIAGDEIRAWVKGIKKLFGKKDKKPDHYHGQLSCGKEMIGKTENMRYSADAPEMEKTQGKYVVIFRNLSTKHQVEGTLFVSYPGEVNELDKEAEQMFECYPDLTVSDVKLNEQRQLVITVKNLSKCGGVHIARWQQTGKDAITLTANVNGRNYGQTLNSIDANSNLTYPNSALTYTMEKVKITSAAKVTVTVDATNQTIETNENNNSKTIEFEAPFKTAEKKNAPLALSLPKPQEQPSAPTGQPDIKINSIYLDNNKQVIVEIVNVGTAGLAASLWNSSQQPYLDIKENKKLLKSVSIQQLDPGKNLANANGKVLFETGYTVNKFVLIGAVADPSNLTAEENEGNNSKEVLFHP